MKEISSSTGTPETAHCPSASYASVDKLLSILSPNDESEESFRQLVSFLNESNALCPGHKRGCRLRTARFILRALRASFPSLEAENNTATTNSKNNNLPSSPVKPTQATPTLTETAFPPLVTTKKGKRRIRPATLTTLPTTTPTAWGQNVEANNATALGDNVPNGNVWERRLSANEATLSSTTTRTPTKHRASLHVAAAADPSPRKALGVMIGNESSTKIVELKRLKQNPPSMLVVRLIKVYTTMVEALLVPSTPGEVVLWLRLLVAATTHPIWTCPSQDSLLRHETDFRIATIQLATGILMDWADRLAAWGLGRYLVDCPPLQIYCPDLVETVQAYLKQAQATTSPHHARPTTAFWSLPFSEARDSRHRYRKPDEMALYKNREEIRDVFLSHLRSFYQQSTVPRNDDAVGRVRRAVRDVLDPLWEINFPWLAEVITDLLLQLGCVPVQEFDEEVLQMASQDKVQKLHQRFKAPVRHGQSRRGPKRAGTTPTSQGRQAIAIQEEYFRGHQEFFFYFVILADSHKLNHHLRHQFLERLTKMSSYALPSNVDRTLDDLCLLGRFLGLLVFYPNWHSSQMSLDEGRSRSLVYDEMDSLRFGNSDIPTFLLHAVKSGRLIGTVPWLVELLRMSLWDESFCRTKSFREISRLLRMIQLHIARGLYRASVVCHEFLLLSLESFVDEIAGLDTVEEFDEMDWKNLHLRAKPEQPDGLDMQVRSLEISTVLAASRQMEIVRTTLTDITRSSRGLRRSPGASRKVRPNIVKDLQSESSRMFGSTEMVVDGESKTRNDLMASFSHQHRELHQICEFTVGQVYRGLINLWKPVQVNELLVLNADERSVDWKRTEQKLVGVYLATMKAELERCLLQCVNVFAADSDEDVKRIAISIFVKEGLQKGRAKLDAMTLETVSHARSKYERAREATVEKAVTSDLYMFEGVLSTFQAVRSCLASVEKATTNMNCVEHTITQARSSLDSWISMESLENPPEDMLRNFFGVVADIDTLLAKLLPILVSGDDARVRNREKVIVAREAVLLAASSMRVCKYGFRRLYSYLSEPSQLSNFVSVVEDCHETECSRSLLLRVLGKARLIPMSMRLDVND